MPEVVQTDQHLAQESLRARGLATRLEHADRDLGDGLLDVGERERLVGIGRSQHCELGVAVGRAGRGPEIELEDPAHLVAVLGEQRRVQAESGPDPAQDSRNETRRAAAIQDDDGARVTCQDRAHGEERAPQCCRLPAAIVAWRRAEDPLHGQARGRGTAEDDRRGEIGERDVLDAPSDRQLGQHKPHTRPWIEAPRKDRPL